VRTQIFHGNVYRVAPPRGGGRRYYKSLEEMTCNFVLYPWYRASDLLTPGRGRWYYAPVEGAGVSRNKQKVNNGVSAWRNLCVQNQSGDRSSDSIGGQVAGHLDLIGGQVMDRSSDSIGDHVTEIILSSETVVVWTTIPTDDELWCHPFNTFGHSYIEIKKLSGRFKPILKLMIQKRKNR